MFKLNSHDLYGLPNESYRRGNFEFQFSSPDSIPNAVKRYNKQRTAELAQTRKDREPTKPTMPRFCKMRHSGNDIISMVTSRDLDVETQLSMESSLVLDEYDDNDEEDPISTDNQNDSEPHYQRLFGGAENKTNTKTKKSKTKSRKKTIAEKGDEACQQIEALHREVCAELEFMEHGIPVGVKPNVLVAAPSKPKHSTASPKRRNKKEVKEKRKTLPKAEEILERLKLVLGARSELVDIVPQSAPKNNNDIQVLQDIQDVHTERAVQGVEAIQNVQGCHGAEGDRIHPIQQNSISYEEYPQQQAQWVDIMPSAMMWQAMQVNVCNVAKATPMAAYEFMDQHSSVEPEPMTPFFLEDVDLEHEYENRSDYLRYLEPRPTCPSSEADDEEYPAQICMSPVVAAAAGDQNENRLPVNVRRPCFVELEHRPHRISLLRSMQPMRYTSQRSEETHDPSEEDGANEKMTNKMVIGKSEKVKKEKKEGKKGKLELVKKEGPQTKSNHKKSIGLPPPKSQKSGKSKTEKTQAKIPSMRQTVSSSPNPPAPKSSSKKQQVRRAMKTKCKQTKTEEHVTETRIRYPGGRDGPVVSNLINVATFIPPPPSPKEESMSPIYERLAQRRRRNRSHPIIVCSRSLENLKYEKLTIYNKISLTQERIISSLDRLQNSLLQLHVPHCNALERQRRERNAFEFCVRFARNFLYPLKGMIDDVRSTTVSSFNSAKSNEACQRVVCIYGLILQSVQTFQRQLRYFLLDKVPQKLSALIEMIYTMTNVCLEKSIMDRQDPVVECLQQRCTKFLTFIEDMQEERFQLARETYRRLKKRGQKMSRPRYHHYHRTQSEVRSQRYDLKMYLNDLKFYEPRLVPRKNKRPRPLLRVRKVKGNSVAASTVTGSVGASVGAGGVTKVSSNAELPPAIDKMVVTQIEHVHCCGDASSAISINSNMMASNFDDNKPSCSRRHNEKKDRSKTGSQQKQQLHKALFEALQHVSKNQVQQVLDPIMRSLETMLQERVQPNTD